MDPLDAVPFELARRADTGKHQELRRVDGAAAQDDLAPAGRGFVATLRAISDPDGATALEGDAGCERVRRDRQRTAGFFALPALALALLSPRASSCS